MPDPAEPLPGPDELTPCECCRTNDNPGFKHGGKCVDCTHTPRSHVELERFLKRDREHAIRANAGREQALAERDLALWLHAEAAWRRARWRDDAHAWREHATKARAERDQLQARIDAALAVLDEPVPHLRRTDPGLMGMNARRNQEQLVQRLRAALQGDQPEVPGG